jgi:hypothetical protein
MVVDLLDKSDNKRHKSDRESRDELISLDDEKEEEEDEEDVTEIDSGAESGRTSNIGSRVMEKSCEYTNIQSYSRKFLMGFVSLSITAIISYLSIINIFIFRNNIFRYWEFRRHFENKESNQKISFARKQY